MRYMYSLEIVIVARSLRSHVKIMSNLTTVPTRSQISNKSPPYRIPNARMVGFTLGYSSRARTASQGHVKVFHNPTVWHMVDIELFAPAQAAASLFPVAY